jgi:hypothetical protein
LASLIVDVGDQSTAPRGQNNQGKKICQGKE